MSWPKQQTYRGRCYSWHQREHARFPIYVRDAGSGFEKKPKSRLIWKQQRMTRCTGCSFKIWEAGTGIYDFIYVEQDFIYGYLERGFLVNSTQAL